jgi:hypothetical protein
MRKKVETGLILVKEDIFTKIRRNLFSIFFSEEMEILEKIRDLEKPKNKVTGKVIIPKEIKKY